MPEFDASLIAAGDPKPIATKILINGSDLELRALGDSLGSWPIAELDLTRVDGGFRMTVDGEQAFLKIGDSQPMADAVATAAKAKTPKKRRSHKGSNRDQPGSTANGVVAAARVEEKTARVEEKAAPAGAAPTDQNHGDKTRLDRVLDAAEGRLGKYLPAWIFTTGGLVVVGLVLILLLVFNNLFSAVLLILGAVGLVASGIALLDDVVAMKIFRGRYTPIQGLIVSLTVGLVGILLGAI